MYRIRTGIVGAMVIGVMAVVLWRAVVAIQGLTQAETTAFLAFPLSVILPGLAFGYLATRRDMVSDEGALMQLGAMIQLTLILALPGFALYLALGFPIVFLVVELFETRFPAALRDRIKRGVLA